MKNYPKTYEDVFSARPKQENRGLKKCKIELVSTDDKFTTDEYVSLMRKTVDKFEIDLFDNLVRVIWLMRRFCYKGRNRSKARFNGFELDAAFGVFMRHHVGVEHRIVTRNQVSYRIISYFDEFFPDFNVLNPFENSDDFKFPYKNIGLGFLSLVYKMHERIELLKYAEENNLKYTEFSDYVLNYVENYNAEKGSDYYIFYIHCNNIPYVGFNKKRIPFAGN